MWVAASLPARLTSVLSPLFDELKRHVEGLWVGHQAEDRVGDARAVDGVGGALVQAPQHRVLAEVQVGGELALLERRRRHGMSARQGRAAWVHGTRRATWPGQRGTVAGAAMGTSRLAAPRGRTHHGKRRIEDVHVDAMEADLHDGHEGPRHRVDLRHVRVGA